MTILWYFLGLVPWSDFPSVQWSPLLLVAAASAFFEDLVELPMNMAGFMSVNRASAECEDQVLTIILEFHKLT